MKRLIAVLLAVAVGSLAMAASLSIDVSGSAHFGVTFGDDGIDVSQSFTKPFWPYEAGLYWSYKISSDGLLVCFDGSSDANAVYVKLTLDSTPFAFTYDTSFAADDYGWSSYIFHDVSGESVIFDFKDFGFQLAYVDVSDPDATPNYFDDIVALKLGSFDLGVGSLDLAGVVVGGETMGFGAEAGLSVDKLSATVGFGNDGTNTGYAVYAEYGDLAIGPLSVSVWAEYTEGLATLTYAKGSDSKAVGASVELGVGAATATVKPTYDLDGKSLTLDAKLEGTAKPLSYSARVVWDDVISAATALYANAKVSVSLPLGLKALVSPTLSAGFEYGYSKTVYYENYYGYAWPYGGPGADKWKASVSLSGSLYGLLSASASVGFNSDNETSWSVKLSKTVSF